MRPLLGWGLFVVMGPYPVRILAAQERTTVGGYGEVHYSNPTGPKPPPVVNLARFVVYLAHSFDDRWALRSELEVEGARIVGGQVGGEVALEQAYLDYRLADWITLRTGLVLPPVGIINETHEPPTFNGVDRPGFDHDVIPTTWREIGLGATGRVPAVAGLSYRVYLVNGLRAAGVSAAEGIREGRQEGREASLANPSLTGRLEGARPRPGGVTEADGFRGAGALRSARGRSRRHDQGRDPGAAHHDVRSLLQADLQHRVQGRLSAAAQQGRGRPSRSRESRHRVSILT